MPPKAQLAIPAAALQDARSFELLRVWVANEDQHVILRAGAWQDPRPWGIVLADLARHIANSLCKPGGTSREDILEKIESAFLDELEVPTGDTSGELG
jgi:Domain of unknown function (DUF5076)